MDRLLFKIEQTYYVTGRGLVLNPGPTDFIAIVGSTLKLVRPDKSSIQTTVKGVASRHHHDILVDENIKKEDVPSGTEVWLLMDH